MIHKKYLKEDNKFVVKFETESSNLGYNFIYCYLYPISVFREGKFDTIAAAICWDGLTAKEYNNYGSLITSYSNEFKLELKKIDISKYGEL
jgi:hypothetical protein